MMTPHNDSQPNLYILLFLRAFSQGQLYASLLVGKYVEALTARPFQKAIVDLHSLRLNIFKSL
jgi:hypothetical protein